MAYFDYIISPSRIRQKRSHVHGEVPPPGSLRPGEIAVNAADGKMYVGTTGDTVTEVAGGGEASTGDITFSGVQIVGSGEDSGDGNGYGTIELVPDASRYAQDQYLVVDPTQPNHIHLRAGGTQDASNAELILGGEHAHVRVVDSGREVNVTSSAGGPVTVSFSASCDLNHLCETYLPPGTTVEYNGVVYTVISYGIENGCAESTEVIFSPSAFNFDTETPLFSDAGPLTAIRPFAHKTWTFGNDGVLDLASGGLRFADNSVQTTAPQNFAYSYQDGDHGGGRSVGAHSMDVYSLPNGGINSVVVSADFQGGTDDGWDARVVLSHMPSPGGATKTLTISAANGITFPDNTTQGSAGIVSVFGGWAFGSLQRVQNIIKISQADYDIIANDGSLSPDTVYIIVG